MLSNAKNIVAMMLCATVCIVIVSSVIATLFYPPGTVTETFRVKIFELLIYILGVISGWLLNRGQPEPPPKP